MYSHSTLTLALFPIRPILSLNLSLNGCWIIMSPLNSTGVWRTDEEWHMDICWVHNFLLMSLSQVFNPWSLKVIVVLRPPLSTHLTVRLPVRMMVSGHYIYIKKKYQFNLLQTLQVCLLGESSEIFEFSAPCRNICPPPPLLGYKLVKSKSSSH